MRRQVLAIMMCSTLAMGTLAGCAGSATPSGDSSAQSASAQASSSAEDASSPAATSSTATAATSTTSSSVQTSALDTSDLFTDRDLQQTADTSDARTITVENGQDVTVSEEGVYILSGTANDATVTVDADSSAKVQLVLDGLTIENGDSAAIYVASADKVFITTANGSTNTLSVTGTFAANADDNVDGVIFSKDDLVLNGEGSLAIESTGNGIVGKDDVKVTGGTYNITAGNHGIQGKDSVAIDGGVFSISAGKDGIHSENADDPTLGYLYIADGTLDIDAASDGLAAASIAQFDGGTITLDAAEGIEGTYVQVNGGTIDITASDDGINATSKSTAYDVVLAINGGSVTIDMGAGDTDALDANGDLYINGGTVDITAQSPFDYDGTGELNGGTVTVNGSQVTEMQNSMMGGPGGGMGNRQGGQSQGQKGMR